MYRGTSMDSWKTKYSLTNGQPVVPHGEQRNQISVKQSLQENNSHEIGTSDDIPAQKVCIASIKCFALFAQISLLLNICFLKACQYPFL